MSSLTDTLIEEGLIQPPKYLENNVQYETIMGSEAYGCNNPGSSDKDIYGFCIPLKEIVFPHSVGHIGGFGKNLRPTRFDQFQKHHIVHPNKNEYDIVVYNIVRYFQLCMECNPNMIDSLFTPRRCVIHSTQIGEHVRENRKMFLSKRAYHTFRGYSFSQLNLMKGKTVLQWIKWCKNNNHDLYQPPSSTPGIREEELGYGKKLFKKVNQNGVLSKRTEDIVKNGYSTKFAYHLVRLLNEGFQILNDHDIVLDRDREILKSIRRGEWSLERVEQYFEDNERALEGAVHKSTLREFPDELAIRNLLLECLEMHYGSLTEYVTKTNEAELKIMQIRTILGEQ